LISLGSLDNSRPTDIGSDALSEEKERVGLKSKIKPAVLQIPSSSHSESTNLHYTSLLINNIYREL
jgi:hypothetical protein